MTAASPVRAVPAALPAEPAGRRVWVGWPALAATPADGTGMICGMGVYDEGSGFTTATVYLDDVSISAS
jgi:hypothetical protein